MTNRKNLFVRLTRKAAAGAALAVVLGGRTVGTAKQGSVFLVTPERQSAMAQSKFYSTKALTLQERQHHKKLTEKLLAVRKEVVETEKGYEFQYSPADVSVAEVADWVTVESKCCPFFDFHIDLEQEGKLVCLRLTGEEGIKAFIRAEFGLGERSKGN